jgi:hypothetical protein
MNRKFAHRVNGYSHGVFHLTRKKLINIQMKNLYKFLLLAALICLCGNLYAQSISGIKSIVKGNNIEVQYVVKGLKLNQTLKVSLFVSRDGGITYQGPMVEVTGDVGEKIFNGQHSMTWEAMKEMPLENVNAVFDVRGDVVTEKIKKNYFVAYTGNLVTPLGLRVGSLGGLGWYIAALSNTNPGLTGSYTYKDGTITDYDQFSWYEFTGEHKVSAFIALGGITWQVGRNFFMYGGAGYGKEVTLYEINEYSYDGDAPLGVNYAKDTNTSATGVALELGIIIRTRKVLFTGGASSVGFSTPNWQVGLGVSF